MRKYIFLFFSVLPFLLACNGGTPDGIIKQDKMVALLTQVHLTDGTLLSIQQDPDTLYKYGTARFIALFKKYGTDSGQFRRSFIYYSSQPDKLLEIYDKVAKNLQAKTDSITRLIAKQNTRGFGKPGYSPASPGKLGPGGFVPPQALPGRPVPRRVMPQRPVPGVIKYFPGKNKKRDSAHLVKPLE
jgi:hypothetical protein